MKTIFTILLFIFGLPHSTLAQDDMPMPDSATVVAFPWYDNNQFLEDYITERGFYSSSPQARTGCPEYRYQLPVKLHIYLDDLGNTNSNIDAITAQSVLNKANELFDETGTMIHFFQVGSVEFESDETYRSERNTFLEVASFFRNKGDSGIIDIHFVFSSDIAGTGYAITPFYPSYPKSRWNCIIETETTNPGIYKNPGQMGVTLAHELGHTLGLLHTHHPGRLFSLINNKENGEIGDVCFQERVSRTKNNRIDELCLFTFGKKSCEINGDFLCDTNADPNVSSDNATNGVTDTTNVTDGPCVYLPGSTSGDYFEDNDEVPWAPPVNNIMSYSNSTCLNEFSPHQIGQMWYYIENLFEWDYYGDFSGHTQPICTSGQTITLQNPPPGMNLKWKVSPESLIDPSTRSGSGISAFIKAANGFQRGWVTVTFHEGNDCNFFNTSVDVWVGKPNSPVFDYYPSTFGCTAGEVGLAYQDGVDSYTFNVSGGIITQSNSASFTGSQSFINVDPNDLGTSMTITATASNTCGTTFPASVTVPVSCNPGNPGGPCCITPQIVINPNPSPGDIDISITNIEELEAYQESSELVYQVEITDLLGNSKKKGALNKNGLSMNLKHLDPGVYLVNISKKDFYETYRIVIE